MLRKILIISLIVSSVTLSQFKNEDKNSPNIRNGIVNYSPSGFLSNIFNPNNFDIHHSVGMSYTSFGGNGVALSTYTNSMAYRFSNDLNVEVDASLVVSPYSTYGEQHQKSINGIYLSRAALNYTPTKNMYLSIQYLNLPPGSYYYRNNRFSSPFGGRGFGTGF